MTKRLIYFIHGLGGNSNGTWGVFPSLIKADSTLADIEVGAFSFPTMLYRIPFFSKKSLKIQTLADSLRTLIDTRFNDHTNLILVCHSLGGLIARRYLLEEVKQGRELRVQGLLLYAVPNDGAGLANLASLISWQHNQLRQLCLDSDLIQDLNRDWATFNMSERLKIRYVVAGQDNVVVERSARSSWGEANVDVVSDRGHINLVKPRDAEDLPYLLLRKFVTSCWSPPRDAAMDQIGQYATRPQNSETTPVSRKGYRVIAFDLDGTLLRGLDFSWTQVWNYLGISEVVSKAAMRDYRRGVTNYQEWCDVACSNYRGKGLKRSDFKNIVNGLHITKNMEETLKTLRAAGFKLAIISGGIDTFIEEMIPNAKDLFDYICINRFHYEQPSGLLARVEPTPFDFAGKTAGLDAICRKHGCTLREAVFVGEGFNDEDVVNRVGLSIAYPPGEIAIEAASISVKEDDLSQILQHVL